MRPCDITIAALRDSQFQSCLSENILHTYRLCEVIELQAEDTTYIDSCGNVDISSLPDDICPNSSYFFTFISTICRQSWNYWQTQKGIEVQLQDLSTLVYLSLQHSTMLENKLITLIGDKSPLLLKDALRHAALREHFPPLLVQLLQYLLLPSGLNFRNVIWHGFAAPSEVNPKFCTLLMSLCSTVSLAVSLSAMNSSNNHLSSARAMFEGHGDMTRHFTPLLFMHIMPGGDDPQSHLLVQLVRKSLFVLPGRDHLVLSAVQDCRRGRHVTCLMKLIPCLENSLRFLFCLANGPSAYNYMMADVDVYYSTLDGFGQRSKHQLLLDPYCFEYNRQLSTSVRLGENKLLGVLGEGFYSLLVDLFFADTGPNVRASLAHGVNVPYDSPHSTPPPCPPSANSHNSTGDMAHIVVALFLSMSMKFYRLDGSTDDEEFLPSFSGYSPAGASETSSDAIFHQQLQRCFDMCHTWQSLYHPNRILARLLQREAVGSLRVLVRQARQRNHVCLSREAAEDTTMMSRGSDVLEVKICRQVVDPSVTPPNERFVLISTCSDKESRIFGNFLHSGMHQGDSSGGVVKTAAAPGGGEIRQLMKTKSTCTAAHDVIHTCVRLSSLLVAAVASVAASASAARGSTSTSDTGINIFAGTAGNGVDGRAHPAIETLDLLRHLQAWTQPVVQCHESLVFPAHCFSSSKTHEEEEEEGEVELGDDCVSTLLDIFLRKHCSVSSQPLAGLPCCLTLLNLMSALCSELHESIAQKELLLVSCSSHTGDRRQYLLQLLCLSPVVQSLATFTLTAVVASVLWSHWVAPPPSSASEAARKDPTASMTPLLAGLASATSSFSACIFSTSTSTSKGPADGTGSAASAVQAGAGGGGSKKNPEQALAQLQRFLDSKVVKASISKFEMMMTQTQKISSVPIK